MVVGSEGHTEMCPANQGEAGGRRRRHIGPFRGLLAPQEPIGQTVELGARSKGSHTPKGSYGRWLVQLNSDRQELRKVALFCGSRAITPRDETSRDRAASDARATVSSRSRSSTRALPGVDNRALIKGRFTVNFFKESPLLNLANRQIMQRDHLDLLGCRRRHHGDGRPSLGSIGQKTYSTHGLALRPAPELLVSTSLDQFDRPPRQSLPACSGTLDVLFQIDRHHLTFTATGPISQYLS